MRPKFTLRARRAATALGALCTITTVAVLPAAAQTARPAVRTSTTPSTAPATSAESTATAAAASAAPSAVAVRARRLDVVAGSRARVRGHLVPALGGRRVALQRRSRGAWHTVDRAKTDARGTFKLAFHPQSTGSAPVRVSAGAVNRRVGRLNVYRTAMVSWYGPGLYGNPLGCGGTLTPSTLGVAHKALPCGTKLTLRHGSRRVRVRVVDRGPYVGGREFDLTSATRARLGFDGVGTILVNR
jgi:peptidoglycan lytic transglycosylase